MLKQKRAPTPPVPSVSPPPVDPRLAQRHMQVVEEAAGQYEIAHGPGSAKLAVKHEGLDALTKSPRKRKVMARYKAAVDGQRLFPLGVACKSSAFKAPSLGSALRRRARSAPTTMSLSGGFAITRQTANRGRAVGRPRAFRWPAAGSHFPAPRDPVDKKVPLIRGLLTPPCPDDRQAVLGTSVLIPRPIQEDDGAEAEDEEEDDGIAEV